MIASKLSFNIQICHTKIWFSSDFKVTLKTADNLKVFEKFSRQIPTFFLSVESFYLPLKTAKKEHRGLTCTLNCNVSL